MAQWMRHLTQGIPGSSPGRVAFYAQLSTEIAQYTIIKFIIHLRDPKEKCYLIRSGSSVCRNFLLLYLIVIVVL